MLPGGIDGLHILETLRGRKNAVPVLILSALAEDDERDVIDGLVRTWCAACKIGQRICCDSGGRHRTRRRAPRWSEKR
jgi:CheY-like chemotaxis protein